MILALERFPSKMVKISLDIQRGRHRHQENGASPELCFPYYSKQMRLSIPEAVKLYWQAHEINLAKYPPKCLLSGS